jgi:hypothetical protein
MEKRTQQDEFTKNVRDLEEWQNHQYDPYYYTGRRIPPFYKGPRPNKFGYGLLLMGIIFVLASLFAIGSAMKDNGLDVASLTIAVFLGALGATQIVSGLRLLRN